MTLTFVPGTARCVFVSLASSCWRLCIFWSSASCSRLKNDEGGGRAAERLVDGAVLGQEGLRPAIGPDWIELKGSTADAHIRGLVVWVGGDPRGINPLAHSGYLIPPPAADS